MPKRKWSGNTVVRSRNPLNKEEMMTETVYLVLQYNLYKNLASNDITLVQYAQKLNTEELRHFNNKLKHILSQPK